MNKLINMKFYKSFNSLPSAYKDLTIYFFYAIVIFLAFYLKFGSFGLYEDDYWYLAIPANSDWNEFVQFIKAQLVNTVENRGRYIGAVFPFLLSYLTYHVGGLKFVYLFGVLLVAVNSLLIYKILKKAFPVNLAIIAGLIFSLYPADTTKALIVHIYNLNTSLLCALGGLLLFLNNRKVLGYFVAFLSMLNYENAFLPFVLAPLLATLNWDKKLIRNLIVHWLIIGAYFILLVFLRKTSGEVTINNIETSQFIYNTMKSLVLGPLTAALAFFIAIYESISNFNQVYFNVIATFILIGLGSCLYFSDSIKISLNSNDLKDYSINRTVILKTFCIAITLTVIGYAFGFSHEPFVFKGRMTSVHFGGALGMSLLAASIIYFVYIYLKNNLLKKFYIVFFSLFMSFLAGYGMIIQNDYIKSWNLQKKFWSKVIELCPDVKENTLILVMKKNTRETDYALSYSWASPLILENLYEFPYEWKRKPKVEIIDSALDYMIFDVGKKQYFKPKYTVGYDYKNLIEIENGNFILLEMNNHELKRLTGKLKLKNGMEIPIKNKEAVYTTIGFPTTALYKNMIKE